MSKFDDADPGCRQQLGQQYLDELQALVEMLRQNASSDVVCSQRKKVAALGQQWESACADRWPAFRAA